ncbi:MAG: HAMP domain-containing sensor histidine kinase, partial [Bacteroidota bacterium]
ELMPSTQSIVLFTYHGEEIKMKNSRHAGELPPSDNDPEKRANIANYVIEHNTQWITSANQHDEIVAKANPNLKDLEKTFWRINKIQSVAAVRLEYDGRIFGVMFFNYTDQKDFNKKDARRIIEAFTNLATTALINEDYIKKIREESTKMERLNSDLLKTQENIKSEKRKVEKEKRRVERENQALAARMEEILPKAATASYFLILQGVNHDIRNFLLAMQADLFEITVHTGGKSKEVLETNIEDIDHNVDNINNLLKLFDFRDDVGKERVDINEVINEVKKFFKNKDKKVNFVPHFQTKMPTLLCLKAEFSMIIYNLINNAVRAMSNEGTITIKTKFDAHLYQIEIEDDGIGFDNSLVDEIFNFGYSTKPDGMGIGLFFVKQTIERKLEGTIEAKSFKNKGSRFIIKIPDYINYKD